MNRRGFLGMLAGAAFAVAIPLRLASGMPKLGYAVDVPLSSADLMLGLDDFESRMLQPIMAALAKKLDEDCYHFLAGAA